MQPFPVKRTNRGRIPSGESRTHIPGICSFVTDFLPKINCDLVHLNYILYMYSQPCSHHDNPTKNTHALSVEAIQ